MEAGMDTSRAAAREKDLRAALKREAGSGLPSSGQCSGKGEKGAWAAAVVRTDFRMHIFVRGWGRVVQAGVRKGVWE